MKLISFAVPSYNSEKYLNHCIDSLLIAGNDAEIIIINDGSSDRTLEIALNYQTKYPTIVKVIDQENGGHGEGINSGLKNATGLFFKVVDSDDWVDSDALQVFIKKVKKHLAEGVVPDLYITDFIYEHVEDNTSFVRSYKDYFKQDQFFTWHNLEKKFKYSATMLMHALIYKTESLRKSTIVLPKHTFYVDNIFSYVPLPYMSKIYYLKVVFYHYFIGRSDQSIQLHNIIDRYQQQIRVMKIMFSSYSYSLLNKLPKGLSRYMKHNLNVMMLMTTMFTIGEYSKERKNDLQELWKSFKEEDVKLYRMLKYRSYVSLVNFLPWKIKSYLLIKGYLYFANKIKLG